METLRAQPPLPPKSPRTRIEPLLDRYGNPYKVRIFGNPPEAKDIVTHHVNVALEDPLEERGIEVMTPQGTHCYSKVRLQSEQIKTGEATKVVETILNLVSERSTVLIGDDVRNKFVKPRSPYRKPFRHHSKEQTTIMDQVKVIFSEETT